MMLEGEGFEGCGSINRKKVLLCFASLCSRRGKITKSRTKGSLRQKK